MLVIAKLLEKHAYLKYCHNLLHKSNSNFHFQSRLFRLNIFNFFIEDEMNLSQY